MGKQLNGIPKIWSWQMTIKHFYNDRKYVFGKKENWQKHEKNTCTKWNGS
jgi:hypothetical protein